MLIGSALILLILVGMVLFFYRPTRLALERAEAFQFRRMLVTKQADKGAYRFFYVTNRRLVNADGPVDDRFGNQREETLKFRSVRYRHRTYAGHRHDHQPDRLVPERRNSAPTGPIPDPAGVRRAIAGTGSRLSVPIDSDQYTRIPGALSLGTSKKPHFWVMFWTSTRRCWRLDWPGNQGSTPRMYRRAQRIAGESGAELARTLELLLRQVQPERLWIVCEQHGRSGRSVHAFHILYRDADLSDAETEIEDVVLTAPDVAREEFNDQFKREISALTRNLTVYVSSNDRALLMSRVINRGRRVGESTLNTRNPDQSDEARRLSRKLIEPDSQRITLVDVTPGKPDPQFSQLQP